MSRLSCPNPELFTRYSKAELDTDLCLKSCLSCACHPVSLHVLQTYSDQLADFCKIGLTSGKSDLVLENVPPKALEMFIHAVYGSSLKETLCASFTKDRDIRDLRDITSFGHKYNIGQIESAVCDILISHLEDYWEVDHRVITDFYNEVPVEPHAL